MQACGEGRRLLVRMPPPTVAVVLPAADRARDRVDVVVWHRELGVVRVLAGRPGSVQLPATPVGWERVAVVRVPAGCSDLAADMVQNVGVEEAGRG